MRRRALLSPEKQAFFDGFDRQVIEIPVPSSERVVVQSGIRKGQTGTVIGEENTLLGPMLKVDFGDLGTGLIESQFLKPL